MNTSAHLATGFSRKGTLPLPWRWHVLVVLGSPGSETLRPRTSPLGDLYTQTLHPHLLVIDCAQVGMIGQTSTLLLK